MLHWKATILPVAAGIAASSLLMLQSAESQDGGPAFNLNHNCTFCHAVHNGSGNQDLLILADVENLCQTCHGAGGSSIYKAEVHENAERSDYGIFRFTCRECHDPHSEYPNWLGGTNIRLVGVDVDGSGLAKVNTPNNGIRDVVFESRGSDYGEPTLHSFADADEDGNGVYDGVCENCHTLTKHHRNNAGGNHNHNTGRGCTDGCHKHTTFFRRR